MNTKLCNEKRLDFSSCGLLILGRIQVGGDVSCLRPKSSKIRQSQNVKAMKQANEQNPCGGFCVFGCSAVLLPWLLPLYILNNSFRVRVLVREGEIVDNGFGEKRRRRAQEKTYKENAGGTKHLEGTIILVCGGLFDLLLASVKQTLWDVSGLAKSLKACPWMHS